MNAGDRLAISVWGSETFRDRFDVPANKRMQTDHFRDGPLVFPAHASVPIRTYPYPSVPARHQTTHVQLDLRFHRFYVGFLSAARVRAISSFLFPHSSFALWATTLARHAFARFSCNIRGGRNIDHTREARELHSVTKCSCFILERSDNASSVKAERDFL